MLSRQAALTNRKTVRSKVPEKTCPTVLMRNCENFAN